MEVEQWLRNYVICRDPYNNAAAHRLVTTDSAEIHALTYIQPALPLSALLLKYLFIHFKK